MALVALALGIIGFGCGAGTTPGDALENNAWIAGTWTGSPDKADTWETNSTDPNATVNNASGDGSGGSTTSLGNTTGSATLGQTLGPVLEVDVRELRFGTDLSTLTFHVRNIGGGALVYNMTVDSPWASVTPANGQSIGETDLVTVRVSRAGLAAREYIGRVTILAGGGASAVVALYVSVEGTHSATLDVAPSRVDLGAGSPQTTLTLRNTGGTPLSYTLSADEPWIRLGGTGGTLAAGQTSVTAVTVDRSQLVVGVHESRVRVLSGATELGSMLLRVEKPVTSPHIIPWIECNWSTQEYLDDTIARVAPWHLVTDTVIISTMPGRTAIYAQLSARLGMRVIPGIQTCTVLDPDDFDNLAGWQTLAAEVASAVAYSGETTIVLENEPGTNTYIDGTAPIDLNQFRQCMSYLPQNLTYLWYPGIMWANPGPRRDRAVALNAVVADVVRTRFLEHSFGHPLWPTFADWISARQQLQGLTPYPNIPIIWFYCCDGFCYWEPTQAASILNVTSAYDEIIFYPGYAHSLEAAPLVNQILWPPP